MKKPVKKPQGKAVAKLAAKPAGKVPAKAAARGSTALATTDLAKALESQSGFANVNAGRDILIPRLVLLQKMSPQIDKKKPEYIKEAEEGDFCDVGTGEIFKKELHLLPVFFAINYLEWAPDRGGLVRNHGSDDTAYHANPPEPGSYDHVTDEGNTIVETATYYLMNLSAGGRRSFLPLSVTNFAAHKAWMTKITSQVAKRESDGSEYKPNIFYRSWKARPLEKSNKKGSWMIWGFDPGETVLELDPEGGLLREAIQFQQQIMGGHVVGDISQDENVTNRPEADGAM